MASSIILHVDGMKCGGCEANVQNQLSALPGVLAVQASSTMRSVQIEFDGNLVSVDALAQAVVDAGYTVLAH